MNPHLEETYQEIAQAAVDLAPDLAGRLLVLAEVEDGVISVDVLYLNQFKAVRLRFGPEPMLDLLYSFWERWKAEQGNREWRRMLMVLDGGKFRIDFAYPDQIDPEDPPWENRPKLIKEYFGDRPIDDSRPHGAERD